MRRHFSLMGKNLVHGLIPIEHILPHMYSRRYEEGGEFKWDFFGTPHLTPPLIISTRLVIVQVDIHRVCWLRLFTWCCGPYKFGPARVSDQLEVTPIDDRESVRRVDPDGTIREFTKGQEWTLWDLLEEKKD